MGWDGMGWDGMGWDGMGWTLQGEQFIRRWKGVWEGFSFLGLSEWSLDAGGSGILKPKRSFRPEFSKEQKDP